MKCYLLNVNVCNVCKGGRWCVYCVCLWVVCLYSCMCTSVHMELMYVYCKCLHIRVWYDHMYIHTHAGGAHIVWVVTVCAYICMSVSGCAPGEVEL